MNTHIARKAMGILMAATLLANVIKVSEQTKMELHELVGFHLFGKTGLTKREKCAARFRRAK